MAKNFPSALEWSKQSGFQAFAIADLISAPNSAIVNRAQIPNLAADLGPRQGIDRIHTPSIFEIQTEFGPSNERVYGVINDDRGLIRFVGNWANNISDTGQYISTTTTNDYVEITFYGTGLNLLYLANATTPAAFYSLDGAAEAAISFPTASSVQANRNYGINTVLNIVASTSAGIHTVKIRNNSSNALRIYGFEAINDSTTLRINSGSAFDGLRKINLGSSQSIANNSTFESGTLGTRGGRVIVYLKSDGTVAKAVQPVNPSLAYLTSADHTNEEVIRRYYWREFGANRSDDWSTLTTSGATKAFTLDDGTTSLIGNTVANSTAVTDSFQCVSTSDYWTLTFVGTGLDYVRADAGSTNDAHAVTVDAAAAGNLATTGVTGRRYIEKIVSGLPYGTHTVRVTRSAAAVNHIGFHSFIVYGPKKPTLPAGAIELADYNVVADFVGNATAGITTISTGVIRKHAASREAIFNGSWSYGSLSPSSYIGGWVVNSSTSSGYAEYSFWGTGFEIRGQAFNSGWSTNIGVTLNGTNVTAANFPTATFATYGGYTFASPPTLSMNAAATDGSGFRVSGLPLARYTLRLTNNTSSNMAIEMIDIITPIHAPRSQIPGDLQNTLPVGSCSLLDSRKYFPLREAQAQKFRGQAVGVASGPSSTSTIYVPIPDLSLTVPSRGGWFDISSSVSLDNTGSANTFTQIYIDGVAVLGTETQMSSSSTVMIHQRTLQYLAPGVHKIDVYGKVAGNTVVYRSIDRALTVEEL